MTQKPTEFGLGVTDFCMNCVHYAMNGPANDPLYSGTCRATLPTHRGFPVVYADQWCRHHVLHRSEQMKRLQEISELNKANRMQGQIFNPNDPPMFVRAGGEPITIIPPVNAGKSQQTQAGILPNGMNTWEHYPDVDGL